MPTPSNELARLAGPRCKEIVSAAIERWEDRIRERIRVEMALKLSDESAGGRQARVGVLVTDGLPEPLVSYERDLKTELKEIAGLFRPHLQNFKENAAALDELLVELGKRDKRWAEYRETEKPKIEGLQKLVTYLLDLAAQATLTERVRKINEDILGAYFPLGKNSKRPGAPIIEIYWTVIGAVARTIEVDIEGLTLVVLAHELAHAYSHLGADTDGNRWEVKAFCDSDVSIKEGIAQYYTEKVVKWLGQRYSGNSNNAYAGLLKIQGPPYRIHEKWSVDFAPEIVRAAIIESRNNQVTETDAFLERMEKAKYRLRHQPSKAGSRIPSSYGTSTLI